MGWIKVGILDTDSPETKRMKSDFNRLCAGDPLSDDAPSSAIQSDIELGETWVDPRDRRVNA